MERPLPDRARLLLPPLFLAAVFATQPATAGETAGLVPAVGLRTVVVDGTGKLLGPVISPGVVAFRLKSDGALIKIGITRHGFSNNGALRFDYLTKNCAGQPYLAFPGLIRAAFLDPTTQDAIVYPAGPLKVIHAGSYRTGSLTGECYRVYRDLPRLAGPPGQATLSQLGFVPPFTVQAQ